MVSRGDAEAQRKGGINAKIAKIAKCAKGKFTTEVTERTEEYAADQRGWKQSNSGHRFSQMGPDQNRISLGDALRR